MLFDAKQKPRALPLQGRRQTRIIGDLGDQPIERGNKQSGKVVTVHAQEPKQTPCQQHHGDFPSRTECGPIWLCPVDRTLSECRTNPAADSRR
jgi:hypothetical protein